uniref:PGG domain-containing protein n=1 Tax=Leersia perrieri TaxID=77586 RepID=A0A0D9XPR0_9ORYZ
MAQECEENILACQNASGDTALHLAAMHGHGAAVEALVAARVMASELNNAGMSPLYLAVMSGSVPAVRAIITSCQDASSVGLSLQNALHAAVFQSSDMVDLLLQWKPELASQVDYNGSTPLHFAASNGNRSVVRAILRVVPPSTVYMKDTDGLSALHVAARLGHADVVEKIIKEFPDAEELRDGHGETFLHTAAREKHSSVVSLAIKNSKQSDLLNMQDKHGNTPLHLAVVSGAPIIVDALLRKGKVHTNVLNDDGHTPLDLVLTSTSLFNTLSFVVTLVAFGAQPRPQRHDHLKPWRGKDIAKGIEKMSNGLAVVATLIATVAFTAGFNMPGGYGNNGMASLNYKLRFKCFMVLDALAVATSVVAVILLVYGKVSRSDSWKTSTIAVNFMWVSLLSLVLAFYAALRAVMTTSKAELILYLIVYMGLVSLVVFVGKLIEFSSRICTVWRFVWVWRSPHHAHAVKRAYPFAGISAYNYFFFLFVTVVTSAGFVVLDRLSSWLPDKTISPAPAPL